MDWQFENRIDFFLFDANKEENKIGQTFTLIIPLERLQRKREEGKRERERLTWMIMKMKRKRKKKKKKKDGMIIFRKR